MLKETGLWIVPAIFSFLGWLIGVIVYELMRRPTKRKNKIFIISHLIAVVCLTTLIVVLGYNNLNHKRNYSNIGDNHHIIKYFVEDNEPYVRLAFNRLELEFKNPNNFKLDAFSVRSRDTTINGMQDTMYSIYFTYYLTNASNNKYFSKVSVFGGIPTLQLYNLDTRTNDEYLVIKAENEKTEGETFNSIKESFEQMSDSTRKSIADTIKRAFSK